MQVQPVNPIYYNYSYRVQKTPRIEESPSPCQPLKPLDYSVYHAEVKRVSVYEPFIPKIENRALDAKPEVPLQPIKKENEPLDVRPEVFLFPKTDKSVSFGYHSKLKTLYKKGLLPTVKKGFYGGELSNEVVTLEHLIPHSRGGATCLSNLVLATAENNFKRGNQYLFMFFKPDAAREYFDQFAGVRIKNFDGDKYVKSVKKTLNRMGLFV